MHFILQFTNEIIRKISQKKLSQILTLIHTGEGNAWLGEILSILGTGVVVFVGYIYIRLNRKS
ncbi:hypothetical protein ACWOEJ_09280 [Enterococcus eurekensis]